MNIVVQKYGGASVATPERLKNIAGKIIEERKKGRDMVIIVSAPGDMTDELLAKANQITDSPDERELDVLLATGEQQSIALLAMAIHSMGYEATSFTGSQMGIITNKVHGKAKIERINIRKVLKSLREKNIVIVAGFQGMTKDEEITTLGRGGSDLTAVALAAVLKAKVCELYKDVDGIFTANPRVVSDARKIEKISYEEMLEMASLGAQVVNSRSIEFAKNYNVPIHVRSSFNEKQGTYILKEAKSMEQLKVSSVTYNKDEAKITLLGVQDKPGIAGKLFKAIAKANVNVDMIVQDVSEEGITNISFTVSKSDLKRALRAIEKVKHTIGIKGVVSDENIAKVSVVGVGMRSHSGVAAIMFDALAAKGVNIEMISTSEIKISVVIDEKNTEKAVKALHKRFKLSKKPYIE